MLGWTVNWSDVGVLSQLLLQDSRMLKLDSGRAAAWRGKGGEILAFDAYQVAPQ